MEQAPGTGTDPGSAPLLVACALGIEHFALRSGGGRTLRQAGGAVSVLRTGMGPKAAERALARALRAVPPTTAVLATGFCAGLVPGMHPGDLVVAERTEDAAGSTSCSATAALAAALARTIPGRTVHTGVLAGSDHVVRGPERATLRETGAVAVDMESAATLRTARAQSTTATRPVAAVRVVVDAPEHELVRIGTVSGGISAFRVLRAVLPAFSEWHRTFLLPRR